MAGIPALGTSPRSTGLIRQRAATCSYRRGLLLMGSLLGQAACGGKDGPVEPPPPTTIQRLAFTGVPAQVEAGDTLTVAVTLTTTTGSQVTSVDNPSGVVVQSSTPAVATVIGGAGSGTARVVAVAPGVLTLTATRETLSATSSLTVVSPTVTTLRFTDSVLVLPAGVATRLPVTILGRKGQPLTAPYTLAVLSTTGAAGGVQVSGEQVTAAAGTTAATVAVSLGALQDTIQLVVASQAAAGATLALAQPTVRAGVPFTVFVADPASATLKVGGVFASRTATTTSSATFALPLAPFGSCLGGGATMPVEITTTAGTWTVVLPALNPVRLTISLNDVQYPFAAVQQGCLIAVDPGTYDVLFYRWDLGYDTLNVGNNPSVPYRKSAPEPVALAVRNSSEVAGLFAPPISLPAARMQSSASHAASLRAVHAVESDIHAVTSTDIPRQRVALAAMANQPVWQTSSGGSCAVPTTVGDSVLLFTQRGATGRITGYPGEPGVTNTEHWILAASSANLTVLIDTSYRRTMTPDKVAILAKVVSAYDTAVVPWFAREGLVIPDNDGTGRLVILVPEVRPGESIASSAFSFYYGRPDCPLGSFVNGLPATGSGEMILMRAGLSASQFGVFMSIVVHELAHVVDRANPAVNHNARTRQMWWATEGVAELTKWTWINAAASDPFNARVTTLNQRILEGAPAGIECARPNRETLAFWFERTNIYAQACQFQSWALQGVTRTGVSTGAALRRILTAPSRSTMRDFLMATRGTTAAEFPIVIGDFFAAFIDPSPGTVPRPDVVFGAQNLSVTSLGNSAPIQPVLLRGTEVVRVQIAEVDMQVVRVAGATELLLDVRASAAAVGTRLGVGVRRR
jgi:hypothetical protein